MIPSLRRAATLGTVLLSAAVVLAGCSLIRPDPLPCPRVVIFDQAKALTLYRAGEGRDLTDVTFDIRITNLLGDCGYDFNDDEADIVDIAYLVMIEARRGPAAETDSVTIPYFIAVTDPARNVIAKQVFEVTLTFEDNAQRAQLAEEIEQRIPIAEGTLGTEYETFVGFQYSHEQLDDARRLQNR